MSLRSPESKTVEFKRGPHRLLAGRLEHPTKCPLQDRWLLVGMSESSTWPAGDPSGSHVAIDSCRKSWSRTMNAAPIIPPCPLSVDRRIRRSRVANGGDRS